MWPEPEPSGAGRPTRISHLLVPSLRGIGRSSRRQVTVRMVFLLIGLLIALAMHGVSVWFLELCYGMEVVGPLLVRRLLEIVLTVLLGVLLLSNLVAALSSLFLADDLPLLLTAPIPRRSLFSARFLQQLFHSSAMVLVFGLPVLLAFARVAGGPLTPLAVVAVLLPLLIIPAALASALILLLVTLLPAGRVRAIVVAFSVIAFVVLYLAVRLMQPEQMLNPEGFASVVQLLSSLSGSSTPLLPSSWGTAVIAASFGDAAPASADWLPGLLSLWTGAGAAHAGASALFGWLHPRAFSSSQQSRQVARLSRFWAWLRRHPIPAETRLGTPGRRPPAVDWIRGLGFLAPGGPLREMLVKDAKLLLRDASQWSQLVLLFALVFVYLYNFRFFRRIGEGGLIDELALYLLGLALAGFVTTAVSVRFAFPLMSLEGRVLWLLRSAPVEPHQLLAGKLLATLPPLLLVSEALSVVSALILGVSAALVIFSAVFSALITCVVGSLAVGLGAVFPDYRAESAAKVASSFGALICMTLALMVGLILVVLSIYPAYLLQHARVLRFWPLLFSISGLLITSLLACWLPLKLGARALRRLEL